MPGLLDLLQGIVTKNTTPLGGLSGASPVAGIGQFLTPQASAPQPPAHHGIGWRNILGALSDAASAAGGGNPTYGPGMARQREFDQQSQLEEQRYQREQEDRRHRPQFFNLGEGGIASASEADGVNVLREPTAQQGEQERLFERWQATPPGPERDQLGLMLRGAQYAPGVYQPRIDYQTQARIAAKGAPTYAAMHPTGGGGGGGTGRFGHTKSNPYPVNSREDLMAVPKGTWVSLPNGQTVQRR